MTNSNFHTELSETSTSDSMNYSRLSRRQHYCFTKNKFSTVNVFLCACVCQYTCILCRGIIFVKFDYADVIAVLFNDSVYILEFSKCTRVTFNNKQFILPLASC